MPARTQRFPCGHRSKGRYCHACAQQQQSHRQQQAERHAAKVAWSATFAHDPVDLRAIQHRPDLVRRARDAIGAVAEGTHPIKLGAQQLNYDRNLYSYPVGRDYRLLFRKSGSSVVPECLLSHESYNNYLK